MKGWIGALVVVALLALGYAAYSRPDWFPENFDVPRLIYLLMALLLVSGAAYGFRGLRIDQRSALRNIAVWLGLIAVIALVYFWIR